MKAKLKLLYSIALIVLLSGCTDKTEPVNATMNQTPVPTITPPFPVLEPSTVYVEIRGSAFNPPEIKAVRGTTVKWTNVDSAGHIVNGDGFRSPILNKRDSWSYTFNDSGVFEYNCSIYPSMPHGRIVVE
ncbi:MAG: hypothetical protein OIN88_09680 [Candidatus Methanoperedens sp.]|nr:hypothetical protein [Candidatus Methanoperedens sp.]